MIFRRSGEYLAGVSAWGQFRDALWSVVLACAAIALTKDHSVLLAILGWAIAAFFLFGAWRLIAVGFQILWAEGDAMTRKRR
jgi:hypothetical protein